MKPIVRQYRYWRALTDPS